MDGGERKKSETENEEGGERERETGKGVREREGGRYLPGTCPLVAMALREMAVRKVCLRERM